jgi:Flp pilus assembly protein CpaB
LKKLHIALAVLLAALAGCLGALAADRWANHDADTGLHAFVHDELTLTNEQKQRLETLEARFAVERARLEASARAANAQLAQAMEAEHEYGPRVGAAIDEVHAWAISKKQRSAMSSTCVKFSTPISKDDLTSKCPKLSPTARAADPACR